MWLKARDLFLLPLQRRVRCAGWGGPLLVRYGWRIRHALEWRHRDTVMQLCVWQSGGRWNAQLQCPERRAQPDARMETRELEGIGLTAVIYDQAGIRIVFDGVEDVNHLENFTRAGFALMLELRRNDRVTSPESA